MKPTDSPGDICLSCGLCCDGSLFWAVPLGPQESPPVVLTDEGHLRQPCQCFNGACTIYADRPNECRNFTCDVLDAVVSGQHSRDWATDRIAEMRQTLAALDAALPGTEPSLYRRAAEFLAQLRSDGDDPAVEEHHGAAVQAISDYETALLRFRSLGAE